MGNPSFERRLKEFDMSAEILLLCYGNPQLLPQVSFKSTASVLYHLGIPLCSILFFLLYGNGAKGTEQELSTWPRIC